MSLIKMMLVMVSVAAISTTFGLLRFIQRYHAVIAAFRGKTSYDADNRPLLGMRSNLWASGYDVDGTDQTSLGQFSGRVQQTYKHSVPRFFVPEHGTMF